MLAESEEFVRKFYKIIRGKTNEQTALWANVSRTTCCRWEGGEMCPRIDTIITLLGKKGYEITITKKD